MVEARQGYRIAPALAAKFVGLALMLVGITTFGFALVAAIARWPLWLIALVAIGLALLAVAGGTYLARRAFVLELDDIGYRVRFVRGAGVKAARWADVKDAHTAEVAGSTCVLLRLRSGEQTAIPVEVLAADRDEVVVDVRSRLVG